MTTNKLIHAKQNIGRIYPGTIDIKSPDVCGAQNNVFFVHTKYGNFVVKFSYQDLARKNMVVSNLLAELDIPAPRIHIGHIDGQWYETYPLIPGQTLHQAIGNGLARNQISQVYNDIMVYFRNMDSIPARTLDNQACRHAHQVAQYNIRNTNGGGAAKIFSSLVRLLNVGKQQDMGVYHCDITPKNVLVTENGDFRAFLDLDSVALCNRNFAFSAMAAKYEQLGMQVQYLYDINDALSWRPVDRTRINTMLRLNQFGKYLLWHGKKLCGR